MLIPFDPREEQRKIIDETKSYSLDLMKKLDISKSNSERLTFSLILEKMAEYVDEKPVFEENLPKSTKIEIPIAVDRLVEEPSLLDLLYESLVSADYRKKYGQFLTPSYVSHFMSAWINQHHAKHVLDPAVGTGVFLDSIFQTARPNSVVLSGFDIDPLLLNACYLRLRLGEVPRENIHLHQRDFIRTGVDFGERFDGIICNPPYLNFHNYERDELVGIMEKRYDTKLSRLTNIYSLFFMQSLAFAKRNARIAFITPSEFLYTGYGEELKKFLLSYTTIDSLILIDFRFLLFRTALTTAVITLFHKRKPDPNHKVRFIRVLEWPSTKELLEAVVNGTEYPEKYRMMEIHQKKLNHEEKWLKHFVDIEYVNLLDRLIPLSELARIDRGIATGFNKFFVLNNPLIKKWGIEDKFLVPVISKAIQCQGYDFTIEDWESLKEIGENTLLLYVFEKPTPNLRKYIEYGEEIEADKRFLTRHRAPWYSMEKREPAKILATVFHRKKMRFILNSANVRNLTAFHCVYPRFEDATMTKALLAYLNSDICKDIQKTIRREYGGGLHKFEPGDLEQIPVLDVRQLRSKDLIDLASLFDQLCTAFRNDEMETQKRQDLDDRLKSIISS